MTPRLGAVPRAERPVPDDLGEAMRLERLFGRSGLAQRQKWGRADYRRRTIAKALAGRPGVLLTRTNQPTRSMQDEPGVINTGAACPPGAARSPAREREAVEVAAALADAERQGEDWRVTFTLARRLRARLAGAGGECGAVRPVDHGPRPSQRRGPRPGPPGQSGGPAWATPRRPSGQRAGAR